MRRSGIEHNEYSFVAILTACIRVFDLKLGLQVHGLAAKMGYLDCVFVSNALMGLYGKCGCLDYALKVFDEMPLRDTTSWNTVMARLVNEAMYDEVFDLFCELLQCEMCVVDCITLSTVLTACTRSNAFLEGQGVHAYAVKTGLEGDLSVGNALIGLYGECGSVRDVGALFERMPVRDVITWTEMITAYMGFGLVELAVEMFDQMPERNSFSYNALMAGFCRNGEGLWALDLFMKMVEQGVT